MRHCGNCAGAAGVAFGAGILLAAVCPVQLMLILAAAALVAVGCLRIKAR